MTFMKDFSYVTQSHPAYIESLYQDFVKDPQSVDADLRKFFEGFDFAVNAGKLSSGTSIPSSIAKGEIVSSDWQAEIKVYRLILGYRNKGHLIATTNPIRTRKDRGAHIKLEDFELTEQDLDRTFQVGQLIGLSNATLRVILEKLNACYASTVGVEYKYISDPVKTDWITQAVEHRLYQPLPIEQKRRVLEKLNQGVMFERFLHTKYVGQKRFSLEGGKLPSPR